MIACRFLIDQEDSFEFSIGNFGVFAQLGKQKFGGIIVALKCDQISRLPIHYALLLNGCYIDATGVYRSTKSLIRLWNYTLVKEHPDKTPVLRAESVETVEVSTDAESSERVRRLVNRLRSEHLIDDQNYETRFIWTGREPESDHFVQVLRESTKADVVGISQHGEAPFAYYCKIGSTFVNSGGICRSITPVFIHIGSRLIEEGKDKLEPLVLSEIDGNIPSLDLELDEKRVERRRRAEMSVNLVRRLERANKFSD